MFESNLFYSCNDGVTGTKCDESPTFFRAGRKRAEHENKENYLAMLRKEILAKQALMAKLDAEETEFEHN